MLQAVAPNIPPALAEEIYRDLSVGSELVFDIPVLPEDSCSSYGYHVPSFAAVWGVRLAKRYGLEPPTRDELQGVRTVEDLLRLLDS